MSKESDDAARMKLAALEAEAGRILGEISTIKEATAAALNGAETARKQADDHASYANSAKLSTEEHSKSVAAFKGQIESDLASINSHKQKADEQAAALSTAKGNAEAELAIITNQKRDAEAAIEEIRKTSSLGSGYLQEIEQAKTTTAEYQTAALASKTKASEGASAAEASSASILAQQTKATESSDLIAECLKSSTQDSLEVSKILALSNKDRDSIIKLLDQLKKSETVSSTYQAKITELAASFENLGKKIEGLLPGATSAGLASAFDAQKQRFGTPQNYWLITFISCIGLLFIISLPTFCRAVFPGVFSQYMGAAPANWNDILMGLAMRLPVLAPLVWLAIYAGRNYMLSLRMEEDYAYKETISRAFEGYKREMKDIASADPANAIVLVTFCENVLRALAERPGRIYEGKQEDFTPTNEASNSLKEIARLSDNIISPGP